MFSGDEYRPLHRGLQTLLHKNSKTANTGDFLHCDLACVDDCHPHLHPCDHIFGETRNIARLSLRVSIKNQIFIIFAVLRRNVPIVMGSISAACTGTTQHRRKRRSGQRWIAVGDTVRFDQPGNRIRDLLHQYRCLHPNANWLVI